MQTPSPVLDTEEFELMETNNELLAANQSGDEEEQNENEEAQGFEESKTSSRSETKSPSDELTQMEEGETAVSPEHSEKRSKRKKHHRREDSEGSSGERSGRKRRHSSTSIDERKKLDKLKEMKFGAEKSGSVDIVREF
jgi:hypothetical protein